VPAGTTVGAWQSGALGYFGADQTVINLDGAVNPDVAGASDGGRSRYLRRRRVEGIVDFDLVVLRLARGLETLQPPPQVDRAAVVPAQGVLPAFVYATVTWPSTP
jgi:hypothetical protein